ncbi:MAG: RNA-binding protein [Cyanobacteria bacterium SID2]|nr:RNA-binding protein [Cyanobacteria bacterium SID2]MBP0003459.1 RNA-binding protein [Cyanobacteria bacterium SBC]
MSDRKLERGQQWLETFMKLANIPARVEGLYDGECYWLTIEPANLTSEGVSTLIGEGGRSIDAIQYLANSILNMGRSEEDQAAYTLELAGYRHQRQTELRSKAEEVAERVRTTGEEIEIAGLSAAERRQIHTFLKDCEDLETYSRGQEPDRRLVVRRR